MYIVIFIVNSKVDEFINFGPAVGGEGWEVTKNTQNTVWNAYDHDHTLCTKDQIHTTRQEMLLWSRKKN